MEYSSTSGLRDCGPSVNVVTDRGLFLGHYDNNIDNNEKSRNLLDSSSLSHLVPLLSVTPLRVSPGPLWCPTRREGHRFQGQFLPRLKTCNETCPGTGGEDPNKRTIRTQRLHSFPSQGRFIYRLVEPFPLLKRRLGGLRCTGV